LGEAEPRATSSVNTWLGPRALLTENASIGSDGWNTLRPTLPAGRPDGGGRSRPLATSNRRSSSRPSTFAWAASSAPSAVALRPLMSHGMWALRGFRLASAKR